MTAPAAVTVAIPNPAALPVVTVDWTDGATTVASNTGTVNIPIGVGVPGLNGAALLEPRTTVPITAASSWSAAWPSSGRLPLVTILDTAGNRVESDVSYDATHVYVVFPGPFTGTITLA